MNDCKFKSSGTPSGQKYLWPPGSGPGCHHASVRPAAWATQLYVLSASLVFCQPVADSRGKAFSSRIANFVVGSAIAASIHVAVLLSPRQPGFRHLFDLAAGCL